MAAKIAVANTQRCVLMIERTTMCIKNEGKAHMCNIEAILFFYRP